ncbi:hypothetical protein J14TS5_49680 [Paenibacillus lautus]|uniref:hypothetical protein n=1 Tax=Paenibacillus lautus TaxID=1401 RepID=UPI001B1E546A|nr:hypothetical protein [Paenibacillus lautus]GIO99882.1 hypothetical protein J14TS5_49680 [Paenibacillus lautus]
MYHIAICNDEEEQREQVKRMLLALSVKTGIDFEVTLFQAGEQMIEHFEIKDEPFHIL